mgnify:CR=1 FL=1
MKNYTKVSISFFLIISSIILTTFLWNKIYLPFKNPLEIIGEYSKQSHNPINDVLRYLIFIFFPLLVTLLCCFLFIKDSFKNIIKQILVLLLSYNFSNSASGFGCGVNCTHTKAIALIQPVSFLTLCQTFLF